MRSQEWEAVRSLVEIAAKYATNADELDKDGKIALRKSVEEAADLLSASEWREVLEKLHRTSILASVL